MDPVRINNIRDFTTPDGLAEKVLNVERSKDGVFEVEKVASSETNLPIGEEKKLIPAYDIEYKVDSSRGKNHYDIRTTVHDKKLYILTCQCKESTFPQVHDTIRNIIDSFSIIQ